MNTQKTSVAQVVASCFKETNSDPLNAAGNAFTLYYILSWRQYLKSRLLVQ